MEVTLGHMTNATPYDHIMNIPTHLRLIKKYLKGIVDIKGIN